MNHFDKIDIRVFDRFIDKFADRYIKQRSEVFSGINAELLQQAESIGCDFNLEALFKKKLLYWLGYIIPQKL